MLQEGKLKTQDSLEALKAKTDIAAAALNVRKKGVDLVFLVDCTGSMVRVSEARCLAHLCSCLSLAAAASPPVMIPALVPCRLSKPPCMLAAAGCQGSSLDRLPPQESHLAEMLTHVQDNFSSARTVHQDAIVRAVSILRLLPVRLDFCHAVHTCPSISDA